MERAKTELERVLTKVRRMLKETQRSVRDSGKNHLLHSYYAAQLPPLENIESYLRSRLGVIEKETTKEAQGIDKSNE